MRANNYTFKKGHRVMVQVQSTWFPLYDRNPQRFVDNILNLRTGRGGEQTECWRDVPPGGAYTTETTPVRN